MFSMLIQKGVELQPADFKCALHFMYYLVQTYKSESVSIYGKYSHDKHFNETVGITDEFHCL